MKLKVYLATGRTVTYYHGIDVLMKSFDAAGIKYEFLSENARSSHSNR